MLWLTVPKSPFFYIVLWVGCSCSMILFNKAVLSQMNFPFPIFLTSWHMLLATILTQILSRTTDMLPSVKKNAIKNTELTSHILPVAICYTASLILYNKAYIYLSVSFIQMLKASTPVVVLMLSVICGLENSSMLELQIVSIISLGVALTSIGELQFHAWGFMIQILGIFAESTRLTLTNVLLKKLKLDSLSTVFYIAPPCCLFNSLLMIAFEANSIPWGRVFSPSFLGILLVNGLVAFSLNIALVLVISSTSALVLTLAGIVKDILLVFLSLVLFRAPVSSLQYIGYAVALLSLNIHREFKKLPTNAWEATPTAITSTAVAANGLTTGQQQLLPEQQPLMEEEAPQGLLLVKSNGSKV